MSSAEIHREPFIHLVDLACDRASSRGAFYFERTDRGRWEIVDDGQLPDRVDRHTCIGASAEPFGPRPSGSSRRQERFRPRLRPTNARGCGCRVSSLRPTTVTAWRSTVGNGLGRAVGLGPH